MPQEPQQRTQGTGSGFVIRKDGLILTNNHVVENAQEITVTLNDKQQYKAKVLGRDPKTDLAVLKIEAGRDLPAARLGDSETLRVGDWVVAIGNPFGLSNTVTTGIVSAKGRMIGAGPYDDFIQTDASIIREIPAGRCSTCRVRLSASTPRFTARAAATSASVSPFP